MKVIKSIDIFGKQVKFKIDEDDSYKTYIGGILTILVYLGMALLTWNFGKDVYEKAQPKLISYIEFLKEYPYMKIENPTFGFVLTMVVGTDIVEPDPRGLYYSGIFETSFYNYTLKKIRNF